MSSFGLAFVIPSARRGGLLRCICRGEGEVSVPLGGMAIGGSDLVADAVLARLRIYIVRNVNGNRAVIDFGLAVEQDFAVGNA